MLFRLFFTLLFVPFHLFAAVILQYHHVSDESSKSTSISPAQFERHMQFLVDNKFTVVPLSTIVESIQKQTPLPDKTVAITFDDAFRNIYDNGKPILDKFNFPYTIFINPPTIGTISGAFLTWQQLKEMADNGAIIANHGYNHDSMARTPKGLTEDQWLNHRKELLLQAEDIIEEKIGQRWQYFAYPYGEYTPQVQNWLKELGFVGFSQQSGAVGLHSDLTSLMRFPASQPYDDLATLKDKIYALPFDIQLTTEQEKTVFNQYQVKQVSFDITVVDFLAEQLTCYVTKIGKQDVQWLNASQVNITFNAPLPVGRVRSNCTAPSISKPGRFYWYSHPWFIKHADGSWYPL